MRTKILADTDSIVLMALVRYHTKSKSREIRRAMLLDLSGSEGHEIAPATFQRCLIRLENLHIIHRIKIGKHTIIVFNIEMVKNTLKEKEESLNLKFQNITEEIEPETWKSFFDSTANEIIEQIASSWASSERRELRYGDSVTKKVISGMVGLIMSHSFEVFILQNSWNKVKSERKQAVEDLIRAIGPFTKGNPNERFTITIHFNGFQQTIDKVSNELYAVTIQEIAPYLLMFSEHVLNHRFSKQDKFFLRHSRIDSLSAPARKCLDIFMNRMRSLIPKSAYNTS